MNFKNLFGNNKEEDEYIKKVLKNEEVIISPDTLRDVRIPPGQHETNKWPVLHAGKVPKDTSHWKFRVWGMVAEEKVYSYREFLSLPKVKIFTDIHCVTSWSKLNNLWEGISTSILKDEVEILNEAKYVMIHSPGNFTTNLPIPDFFKEDVLFATCHNGKKLTKKHGGPLRLVVPQLYFWKSAKWVTGVEFLKKNKPGCWESNGYHIHGDPWSEERYAWQQLR
jgi:DMSO/TMAO reductase YedYZ molybdopterin-dependent catalytic subunit